MTTSTGATLLATLTFTVRINLPDGGQSYPCLPPAKAARLGTELAAQGYPIVYWCVATGRPATLPDVMVAISVGVLDAGRNDGAAWFAEAGRGYDGATDGDWDVTAWEIVAAALCLSDLDREVLWPHYARALRTEADRLATEARERAEGQKRLDDHGGDLFAALFDLGLG